MVGVFDSRHVSAAFLHSIRPTGTSSTVRSSFYFRTEQMCSFYLLRNKSVPSTFEQTKDARGLNSRHSNALSSFGTVPVSYNSTRDLPIF